MIIAVDKPIGPTSHDIVASARRQLGTRKVGHAGTLDPLASGVLLVLSDEHTRLSNFLTASDKSYLAWVSFGATTKTLDAEGPLDKQVEPPGLAELESRLPGLLPGFLDLTEQVPPSYSAVKQAGVKGYEAARRGEALDMPARSAGYHEATLLALAGKLSELPASFAAAGGVWSPATQGRGFELPAELAPLPTALIRLRVQAGTYIRAFARDLGEQLGSGAFLAGLVRTSSGRVGLEQAVPADGIQAAVGLDPLAVLNQPVIRLDSEQAARVRLGQRLGLTFEGLAALVGPDDGLVAIAEAVDGRMKLRAVFPAGD